ncbi:MULTISPECIES: hypothetical protein [Gracilibacillus]|uniref:hypothetical protein n=1 Tax=Gracilibacillus TaxID=74385 RepID=UPI000824611D|nr:MULTISPECIES: hypothetical protein [Gracilibacillus]
MGYIIPVDHYQYQQYQNRITQTKRIPYTVEKLYPSQFDRQYYEIMSEHQKAREERSKRKKQASTSQKYDPMQQETVSAEITGKGRRFEATV